MRLSDEIEAQALERLRRALAHEKERTADFLSLTPRSKVVCGLNAVLRAVQNGRAKLVILPLKSPEPVSDLVQELSRQNGCPLWTPSTSGVGLGRAVGFKKDSPCLAAAFIGEGDSADPLTSIRDYVLKSLMTDIASSQ